MKKILLPLTLFCITQDNIHAMRRFTSIGARTLAAVCGTRPFATITTARLSAKKSFLSTNTHFYEPISKPFQEPSDKNKSISKEMCAIITENIVTREIDGLRPTLDSIADTACAVVDQLVSTLQKSGATASIHAPRKTALTVLALHQAAGYADQWPLSYNEETESLELSPGTDKHCSQEVLHKAYHTFIASLQYGWILEAHWNGIVFTLEKNASAETTPQIYVNFLDVIIKEYGLSTKIDLVVKDTGNSSFYLSIGSDAVVDAVAKVFAFNITPHE